MVTLIRKYSIIVAILILLISLILMWLLPSSRLILGIVFLLFSFGAASFTIIEKHREAYKQGDISRLALVRLTFLEMLGVLLVMLLAGLLGSYFAETVTRPINNDLIRFVGGIVVGLLVGLGVGFLVRQARDRFLFIPPQNKQ